MLALWWFGQPLEHALGRGRFLLLYLVSGLAGSAGALLADAARGHRRRVRRDLRDPRRGAVLERQRRMVFGGQALTLIVINLVFTFAVGGISIGGHIGGLAGGVALHARAAPVPPRARAADRELVAIGVLSVAIAYWKVRGYA